MAYPYLMAGFKDANGVEIGQTSVATTQSTDVMNGWVRASTDIELHPETKFITISMSNDSPGYFSHLMVRHTGWDAYTDFVSDDSFVINNIPVGK
jgi:hypothetical protein